MIKMDVEKNNQSELSKDDLIRIGDLFNFEGPNLVLFQHKIKGSLYVFDWVDSDTNFNRWLIYEIQPLVLLKYLRKFISTKELFTAISIEHLYYADVSNGNNVPITYTIYKLNSLPDLYISSDSGFFNKDYAVNLKNIRHAVSKAITQTNFTTQATEFLTPINQSVVYIPERFSNQNNIKRKVSIEIVWLDVKVNIVNISSNNPFTQETVINRRNEKEIAKLFEVQPMEL